jgi:hypothetical protein
VLSRSIDGDDFFGSTADEKLFRAGKRICILFVLGAVTLSVLDLMNVRSPQNAPELTHVHRGAIVNLPSTIRKSIGDVAFASTRLSAAGAIPAADPDIAIQVAVAASARPPATLAIAQKTIVSESAAPSETLPATVALASLDPGIVMPPRIETPAISLPPLIAVLPPPAPGVPPPSPAQRLHLEGKERAKAERCLAQAVHFEARNQPYKGQVAVAQVVINRVFSSFYPDDVCEVIYQNADRHLACQFTFACDGKSEAITERGAWARARRIARQTLDGRLYVPAVGTATHYHAVYVHPYWTREMHKLVREGMHNFYRPIAWGSGADEPVWSRKALSARKKK